MMRRIAVVGDQLGPYGGQVVGYAGRPAFFHGHQPALIGGKAYCERCKSAGTIAKSGGPRRMQFMGEIALEGDIVVCQCPTPQRIVAVLAGESWYEDMAETTEGGTSGQALADGVGSAVAGDFDEQVRAVGHGASEGYPYLIETAGGRAFFGRLASGGQLPRIFTDSAEDYSVYWGDEALARHDGI